MALPIDQQVPLLLKVLTYDRNFEAKAGEELAIGIVHDPGDRESAAATEQMVANLVRFADKTVKKLPLRYYTIEYTGAADLQSFVKAKRISLLYVAPGSSRNLSPILQVAQSLRVTTATGVPDYVRKGVAVGVGLAQDRPQILINLASSRAEGSDFDASLLRIASILGPR
ncbi:MAG TPA: YfiR family protein [Vicinamibacteria bacterium]|nr:YfiR family protein [Vicinamibacteria bacterium]